MLPDLKELPLRRLSILTQVKESLVTYVCNHYAPRGLKFELEFELDTPSGYLLPEFAWRA